MKKKFSTKKLRPDQLYLDYKNNISRHVPSAITVTVKPSKSTSKRYLHIPSVDIIKPFVLMGAESSFPNAGKQSTPRNEKNIGYQKHYIALTLNYIKRLIDTHFEVQAKRDMYISDVQFSLPEVICYNNHNRGGSCMIQVGIFKHHGDGYPLCYPVILFDSIEFPHKKKDDSDGESEKKEIEDKVSVFAEQVKKHWRQMGKLYETKIYDSSTLKIIIDKVNEYLPNNKQIFWHEANQYIANHGQNLTSLLAYIGKYIAEKGASVKRSRYSMKERRTDYEALKAAYRFACEALKEK